MDPKISRRDFLNGVSVAIGASLLPGCGKSGEPVANVPFAYYPPAETGMRGSHPGSFEVAHATVQGEQWSAESTGEHYDLVVVGAGISGLSAAYIYRRDVDPNARILVLDNHDDFGGHAKRNEFTLDGQTFIGFGGTMQMDAPAAYPAVSLEVIRELGIEFERHEEFEQDERLAAMGLGRIYFFDKETFGADFLTSPDGGLDDAPLSAKGKEQMERLLADEEDYLADLSPDERHAVLQSISWRDYLEEYGGFGEEVLQFVQNFSKPYWAISADALPAWIARETGYPGFGAGRTPAVEPTGDHDLRFRFPDGNASVARLLARKLVPAAAPGNTMEDIVKARFDYSQLDKPEYSTRIRLSSTVVDVHHQDGKLDGDVEVSYVNGGDGRTVTASKLIFAGYHAMLPYICPDMPKEQAAAQSDCVHAPLVYTSVLVRNWRSLADLGLRRVYCPGGFFQIMMLTHAVSIGGSEFPESPDEPVVLHMQHIPGETGLSAPDQFRVGRQALLETSFETFEQEIRDQLGRILGPAGFDHERDIAGITVNRWSHGYAYSSDPDTGEVAWDPEQWRDERRPWVEARQRVGNIAIAGTGASSNAMTESAIEEAHRAVHELKDATS
jgi:spermidine dehydrogenase